MIWKLQIRVLCSSKTPDVVILIIKLDSTSIYLDQWFLLKIFSIEKHVKMVSPIVDPSNRPKDHDLILHYVIKLSGSQ
jgi:hypothetical protein